MLGASNRAFVRWDSGDISANWVTLQETKVSVVNSCLVVSFVDVVNGVSRSQLRQDRQVVCAVAIN